MITVEAVYEHGVLKPKQALMLPEGTEVRLTVSPVESSLAERITALARDLPQDFQNQLPPDGAAQHDHYLYGTPKRPE